MVADAHTTVVVEQLHAAHLEKLVITLSPVPLPAVGQYPPSKQAVPGASSAHPCSDPANLPINAPTPQPCHQHTSAAQPGQQSRPTKTSKADPKRTARWMFASGADAAVAPSASGVAQPHSTLRRSVVLVAAVAAWYTANIGLILTNRRVLSTLLRACGRVDSQKVGRLMENRMPILTMRCPNYVNLFMPMRLPCSLLQASAELRLRAAGVPDADPHGGLGPDAGGPGAPAR